MHQPRYGRFTVRMECPKCGLPVPLDGPKQTITCTSCLSEISIQASLWTQILERKFDSLHHRLRDGAIHVDTLEINGLRTRVEICKAPPCCEQCNAPYPVQDLGTGVEQNFSCTQCGDPASTYPVPDWLKTRVGTAVQIYHTAPRPLHGTSINPNNAIRPVALTCPTCSGSLSAGTDSERIMPCNFCGSEVYLPDEIWRRLHPVKIAEAFFLRFEGPSSWDLKQQAQGARDSAEQLVKSQNKLDRQARKAQKRRHKSAVKVRRAQHGRTLQVRAWISVLIALGAIAAVASYWFSLDKDLLGLLTSNTDLMTAGALALLWLVAMAFASSTLKHASKMDSDWMIFATWFWIPFSLVPPIGIWRFIVLLRGRFSASTITTGGNDHHSGSSKSYKAVRLTGGEGRPAAMLFIPIIVIGGFLSMSIYNASDDAGTASSSTSYSYRSATTSSSSHIAQGSTIISAKTLHHPRI